MEKCKEKFITDINELCETCFIHKKIDDVRLNMIRKYELIEQNNSKDFIENYLKEKIQTANKKIENVCDAENKGGSLYRENRVSLLLSWKDCLKYYNEQLTILKNEEQNHSILLSHASLGAKYNAEKLEQGKEQDKERETKQKNDYDLLIDRNYNYRHDLKDFQKKSQIEKLQGLTNYLKFLSDAEEKYVNAKHFYTVWGDGTLRPIGKSEIYGAIVNFIKTEIDKELQNAQENKSVTNKSELSISQIALIYCYEGKIITRENGNEIAKDYGHNSGEKLFQKITFFSSAQNRKGKPSPSTPKKFQNKIALLESVIEKLSNEAKSRATDELNTLKSLFKNSDS